MTSKERRSLLLGIFVGALIAGAATAGLLLRLQRTQPTESKSMAVETLPLVEAPAVAPAAVQLSPQEQSKIGLQTTDVRRESLTEEILASGRVSEPETAIAAVSTRFGGRIEQLF